LKAEIKQKHKINYKQISMQVRPWGPSITPQAHHFNGDSDVEAKLKYDPLFQNLHYKRPYSGSLKWNNTSPSMILGMMRPNSM
jgi:hypothetical protein